MILQEYLTTQYDDDLIKNIITNLYDYYNECRNEFILKKYQIKGSPRPDRLATVLYGDPNYEWVLLLVNDVIDPWDEWIKSDEIVREQAKKIYENVDDQEYGIHHFVDPLTDDVYWELVEYPVGSKQWYHEGDTTYEHVQFQGNLIPITNVEALIEKNEDNRTINIIDTVDVERFVTRIIDIIYERNN